MKIIEKPLKNYEKLMKHEWKTMKTIEKQMKNYEKLMKICEKQMKNGRFRTSWWPGPNFIEILLDSY